MLDTYDGVVTRSDFTRTFKSRKSMVSPGVFLHHVTGGSGPPVVLLHGFPQSWYMWRKIMLPLSAQHQVIAVDLRGAGDSEKLTGPYDAWTLAGDIHALLASLGVSDRVLVVGHDMGAPVALSFAGRYPDSTRGLVYVDEPIFGVDLESRAAFSPGNSKSLWWWPFHHEPLLAETLLVGHERAYFDHFVFSKTHVANLWAMTEQDKQEYVRHLCEVGGITGALGGYRDVAVTEQHLAQFKTNKIGVPGLGVSTQFGLQGVAEALSHYVAEVTPAMIEDSGHFVAEEQPEALLEAFLQFFGRC